MISSSQYSIAGLTQKCLDLLSVPRESQEARLGTHRERFESWVRSSEALQRDNVSLDHRLRNHERIKLTILELLGLIEKAVTVESAQGLSSRNDQGTSASPSDSILPEANSFKSSKTSNQSRNIETPIVNRDWIGEAISELINLNMMIRRASGPHTRLKLPSNWPWLDQDIEPYFENTALEFLRGIFGATVIKPSLVNQLDDAISRRRKRLLYQWQHERNQRKGKQPSILSREDEGAAGSKQEPSFFTDVDMAHLYPSLPLLEGINEECVCLFCPETFDLWSMSKEVRLKTWR